MEIISVYISPSQSTTSVNICLLRIFHSSILASLYTSRAKCLNIGPLWIKMIHIDLLIVVFSQKQSEERLKVRCLMNPVKLIWARCETSILAEKEQFQNRAENICGKVWCSLWTQIWLRIHAAIKCKQPTMTHEPCDGLCQESLCGSVFSCGVDSESLRFDSPSGLLCPLLVMRQKTSFLIILNQTCFVFILCPCKQLKQDFNLLVI